MAKRQSDKVNPWDRKGRNSGEKRAVGTRDAYRRILIVCEGSETEPNYFNSCKTAFRATLRELKVKGLGKAPSTVVKKTQGILAQEEAKGGPFDEVWCVFDRDNFGEDFDGAIRSAKEADFHVAFSNPSVELWFCLHFRKIEHEISNEDLIGWLETYLKKPYDKADDTLFDILWPNFHKAMERAEFLHAMHSAKPGGLNPATHNPVTLIHELMKSLSRNTRR